MGFVEVLHPPTPEVRVEADVIAYRAPPQLVDRRAERLSQDVPQRHVDAAQGCGPHSSVCVPEGLPIHDLPEVFDSAWILPDDERAEVFDGADYGLRLPLKCCLAPTPQAVLVGQHLDEDPVAHPSVANKSLDTRDLHRQSKLISADDPPSTESTWPVTYSAAGLHRKPTNSATSADLPMRGHGTRLSPLSVA